MTSDGLQPHVELLGGGGGGRGERERERERERDYIKNVHTICIAFINSSSHLLNHKLEPAVLGIYFTIIDWYMYITIDKTSMKSCNKLP